MRTIYLTGFMGVGKTAVGEELAKLLACPFIDTDFEIERKEKRSIPEIFAKEGEKKFRALEASLISDITKKEGVVVALGGGALMDPKTRELLLSTGTVIYLKAPLDRLLDRIRGTDRPLAKEAISLFADRESVYEQAHLTIEADKEHPKQIAEVIVERLK